MEPNKQIRIALLDSRNAKFECGRSEWGSFSLIAAEIDPHKSAKSIGNTHRVPRSIFVNFGIALLDGPIKISEQCAAFLPLPVV